MPTLRRDGVDLWYDEAGTGGPPLLLVHGFGGDHTHMAPLFAHFRTAHRVVTVDRRGHGRSDQPAQDYTIAGFADDLAWLSTELGLHRPVVVVHSMDAIGLDLAARYPHLVGALVLIDGPGFGSAEMRGGLEQAVHGLRTPGYRDVLAYVADNIAFLPGDDSARKATIVAVLASTAQPVLVSTLAEYLAYDVRGAVAACTGTPLLYVGSLFARSCDLDAFRELAAQLVVGQTVGAGHFAMIEVPEQVIGMIEAFLASCRVAPVS
jgi:pimeloyl-ACP methyl ester carboxylesterase